MEARQPVSHHFSRSEINLAAELFRKAIRRYYGEVWDIPWNGEYKGCAWDCRSPLEFDAGIWHLCQQAKHRGAFRAAGSIEQHEAGHVLRFILFYNPKEESES